MLQLLIVISVLFVVSIVLNIILFNKDSELRRNNSKLEKKLSGYKNFMVGRKAIIPNYGLKQVSSGTGFEVTYEVDILEVAENKVKVSAHGYTSTDSFANDPSNRNSIISFYQNQWVDKKMVELIVDKSDSRDFKIEEILSGKSK